MRKEIRIEAATEKAGRGRVLPLTPEAHALLVGMNSDRSVREGKGPGRPITTETERAEVLAALACVDGVVVFDEITPLALVSALQPDILVKGDDWAEDAIVGREVVEARGGRVVRVPIAPGFSTTGIIEKIRTG